MMTLTHTAIASSGLRGLVCAGLSTLITAFFSWSFVASTDHLNWMGSGVQEVPEMATARENLGLQINEA